MRISKLMTKLPEVNAKDRRWIDCLNAGVIAIVGYNGVGKSHLLTEFFKDMSKTIGEGCMLEGTSLWPNKEENVKLDSKEENLRGPWRVVGSIKKRLTSIPEVYEDNELSAASVWGNPYARTELAPERALGFFLPALQSALLNVNDILKEEQKTKFGNLEKRMSAFYHELTNKTMREILAKEGRYDDKSILTEPKYVRIKAAIETFWMKDNSKKEISGLNEDGTRLLFEDLDGKDKGISEELSSGEKILFSIASRFLETEDEAEQIVIWDEPENSLNPSWQRKVIPFLKKITKNRKQFFIVTHSPYILDSLEKKSGVQGKDDVVVLLERDGEGLKLKEINPFTDKKMGSEFTMLTQTFMHIMATSRKWVLVEGKTDKDYLGICLDKEKYEIWNCEGIDKIKNFIRALIALNNKINIIGVIDNDANKKQIDGMKNAAEVDGMKDAAEVDEWKRNFALLSLEGLPEDANIEIYFINHEKILSLQDFEGNEIIREIPKDTKVYRDKNMKEYYRDDELKKMICKSGFLPFGKCFIEKRTLISKTQFYDLIIDKLTPEEIKDALKPLTDAIENAFPEKEIE